MIINKQYIFIHKHIVYNNFIVWYTNNKKIIVERPESSQTRAQIVSLMNCLISSSVY
jgi:hypothetical protein